MSFKPLINHQSLSLDDHYRGTGEMKDFDKQSIDVHIEKKTKYKINGKPTTIIIKIPINSDREITIKIKGKKQNYIPKRLEKEIKDALSEPKKLKQLAKDLMKTLKNYKSEKSDIEKLRDSLDRIAKHFDLEWTGQEVINRFDSEIIHFIRVFHDDKRELYYIELYRNKIKISNVDKGFKKFYRIKDI